MRSPTSTWSWILTLATMAVVTWAWFLGLGHQQWEEIGSDILDRGSWRTNTTAGSAVHRAEVSSEQSLGFALCRLAPPPARDYQIRCDVRYAAETGSLGRVVLITLDTAGNPRFDRPHVVEELLPSDEWRPLVARVKLRDDVDAVDFGLHLHGSSGFLEMRDVSMQPICERAWFRWGRRALATVWIFAGLAATRRLLRGQSMRARLGWCGLLATIVLGTTLPRSFALDVGATLASILPGASAEDELSLQVAELTGVGEDPDTTAQTPPAGIPGERRFLVQHWMQKGGHAALYAMLGALAFLTRARRRALRALALVGAVAIATELMQFYIPGRVPGWTDVWIDLLGGAAGIGITFALSQRAWWAAIRPRRLTAWWSTASNRGRGAAR